MKKDISLNSKELTSVAINLIIVKMFFIYPKKVILNAGNAAWIQMLYVSLLMIPILLLVFLCYKRCGNLSIIELSQKVGGNFLKFITGVFISVALFLNLAATMRSFPEIVKMVLLPNTPIEVIVLIFAVVVGIASLAGIESTAGIHAIFIPFMVGILAIFFLFLIPHAETYNIFPLLGKGGQKIFTTGIEGIDLFDDLIVLNLLLPYAKNASVVKKSVVWGTTISALIAVLIILFYCLVYPYPSSQNFLVPIYQLTRLIGIGDFFQRFEAFFEFIWSFSILLYSVLYIQVICIVWRECFNLRYERPIIFPMMEVITLLAFSAYDMQNIVFNYWYLSGITIFAAFGLPAVLAYLYKRKRKKEELKEG